MGNKNKIVIYLEENLSPYGGRFWIEEEWGKRFSTPEEEKVIEKLRRLERG